MVWGFAAFKPSQLAWQGPRGMGSKRPDFGGMPHASNGPFASHRRCRAVPLAPQRSEGLL